MVDFIIDIIRAHRRLDQPHEGDPVHGLRAGYATVLDERIVVSMRTSRNTLTQEIYFHSSTSYPSANQVREGLLKQKIKCRRYIYITLSMPSDLYLLTILS